MKNDIVKSLNWRYATKSFDSTKKLNQEQIDTLGETLRLSPSSFGLQLWKFVFIENAKLKKKLVEYSWGQKQIEEASHLVIFTIPNKVTQENVEQYINFTAKVRNIDPSELKGLQDVMNGFISGMNDTEKKNWMKNQVYLALGNLLSVTSMMEIDSCPIEGFISTKYDEVLGLDKEEMSSVVVCALGFRNENDKYANAPKIRYPKEDVMSFISL